MNKLLSPADLVPAHFTPYLLRVDVDAVNCGELARYLVRHQPLRRARLIIDCQQLRCVRTHGVAYFVSQLLLLHASGAQLLLLNVAPVVRRCLRVLQLDTVFLLAPEQAAAA